MFLHNKVNIIKTKPLTYLYIKLAIKTINRG